MVGGNDYGQLGTGSTTDAPQSTPIEITALGTSVRQCELGNDHSGAISGGKLYMFGRNHKGQLGDGTTTDRHKPVEITALGTNVSAVAVGHYHTAAISSGKLYMFGWNEDGQLGDGTTTDRHTPVEITALGLAGLPLWHWLKGGRPGTNWHPTLCKRFGGSEGGGLGVSPQHIYPNIYTSD